jgi:hypothetical protein
MCADTVLNLTLELKSSNPPFNLFCDSWVEDACNQEIYASFGLNLIWTSKVSTSTKLISDSIYAITLFIDFSCELLLNDILQNRITLVIVQTFKVNDVILHEWGFQLCKILTT